MTTGTLALIIVAAIVGQILIFKMIGQFHCKNKLKA